MAKRSRDQLDHLVCAVCGSDTFLRLECGWDKWLCRVTGDPENFNFIFHDIELHDSELYETPSLACACCQTDVADTDDLVPESTRDSIKRNLARRGPR